jgi:ribosomal protein S18 acetylase RimI-like enzyme
MDRSIDLRPICEVDLNAVVQVHNGAFPDSALTQLGAEALRRYYQGLLNGPYEAACTGAFLDNRLVGFCFAGVFRGSDADFVRHNLLFLTWRVITHPRLIKNEIIRQRLKYSLQIFKPKARKKKISAGSPRSSTRRFGILSVAVSPDCQGAGVGKILMADAEMQARQKGFHSMRLTVHPDNRQAVLFYERLGWKRRLNHEVWEGFMEKDLN